MADCRFLQRANGHRKGVDEDFGLSESTNGHWNVEGRNGEPYAVSAGEGWRQQLPVPP